MQRQSLFQLLLDAKRPISLAPTLFLLASINALVPFRPSLPLTSTFQFVTTWMTCLILVSLPLRLLCVAIMTMAFKLPPFPLAHLVLSHSIPWAFLPHLLHSQVRGGTGSIAGPRAKAYFTCLPTRTFHLGLVELFSTRMFKLYSVSSILSSPVPRCRLQLFRPLSALFLHLEEILLLHPTFRCQTRSSQSVRLLRKSLVTLRVLCSKIRLVQKNCRTHSSSEEDFFLCYSLIWEDVRGRFVVPFRSTFASFFVTLPSSSWNFYLDVSCFCLSPSPPRLSLPVPLLLLSLAPGSNLIPFSHHPRALKTYPAHRPTIPTFDPRWNIVS